MKIVLVDPKMVEFSVYKTIERHFLAALPEEVDSPIITDTTKVVRTLNSLCVEMARTTTRSSRSANSTPRRDIAICLTSWWSSMSMVT